MQETRPVSKKIWRKEMEESLQVVFANIFRNKNLKGVIRIIIAEKPLDKKYYLTKCGKVLNEEGRTYKIYALQKEKLTEIHVFEKNMSKNNSNKFLTLEDDEQIDEEQKIYYCKSIVNFLLANVI